MKWTSGVAVAAAVVAVCGPGLGRYTAHGADSTPRTGAPAPAQLEPVAEFDHQVTGVAVSEDGRIFVNFPRWSEDAPVSVAEIGPGGELRPYPDGRWNEWRNARKNELPAAERWVCVQSVFADGRGSLWVIDPAAPAVDRIVPGGPKLVRIDLASNRVAEVYGFDERVAPQGSYLNDVRIAADGRHAFITDSGARGAIVVVDLESGNAWRALDGHPSTQPQRGVAVKADGRTLRRPDGRAPEFAADGIALAPDGRHLYWQALTGRTLYRIPTDALSSPRTPPQDLERMVERVGENGVSDGLWFDRDGRMYISALEEDAVKVRDGAGDRVRTVVQDTRLRWPDTFAEGPDGSIYVTSSRIQDMAWFKPESGPRLRTALYRFQPER